MSSCDRRAEAGARWPRCGLVVFATTSCRDNKVQMIRPHELFELAGKNVIIIAGGVLFFTTVGRAPN
jgi:hypothetical protein